MEETFLGRREFSAAAVMALLSGVAISISGCGDDSPTSPSTMPGTGGNPGGTSDKTGAISGNHGHSAVVTNVQLTSGGAVRLDIRGTADHPHTLDLSAAEVGAIAATQRVEKESSNDAGHRHTVTFN
jgi:hypothetical protein